MFKCSNASANKCTKFTLVQTYSQMKVIKRSFQYILVSIHSSWQGRYLAEHLGKEEAGCLYVLCAA